MRTNSLLCSLLIVVCMNQSYAQREITGTNVFLNTSIQPPFAKSGNVVVTAESAALNFTNIPDCTPPEDIRVQEIGTNQVKISWKGKPASPKSIRYVVRYKSPELNEDWIETSIESGTSCIISDLAVDATYQIEVKKICNRKNYALSSEWVRAKNARLSSQRRIISLPPFLCGQSSTVNCAGVWSGDTLGIGDTIRIYGFPILIESISYDSCLAKGLDTTTWCPIQGTGYMPLPFDSTVLKVAFGGFYLTDLDENANVCNTDGWAMGIKNSTSCFPTSNFPPLKVGGNICKSPPSEDEWDDSTGLHRVTGLPWDEWGFGRDGTYKKEPPYEGWEEGDPFDPNFDPNGFDKDGNYLGTGGPYNPNGCTREGLDSLGQPCNPAYCPDPNQTPPCPYFWMDSTATNPPSQEGIEFANEVRDSIRPMVIRALQALQQHYQDSITFKRNDCNGIRTTINGLIPAIPVDRKFICGPNEEYFEEGMHRDFESKPEYLAEHRFPDRNAAVIQLEKKHVELYECDQKLSVYINMVSVIQQLLDTAAVTDLVQTLLAKIERLSASEIDQLKNWNNLYLWVLAQVKLTAKEKYAEIYGAIGAILNPDKAAGWAFENNTKPPISSQVFSGGCSNIDLATFGLSEEMLEEAVSTEILKKTGGQLPANANLQWNFVYDEVGGFGIDDFDDSPMSVGYSCDSLLEPIRLAKRVFGREYIIYLENIFVTPVSATLDAYLVLEIPNTGNKIAFKATGVEFSTTGLPTGSANLSLATDVEIRLSNAALLRIKSGSDSTFVAWNCEGFTGMGIAAEIEFCREYVIPVDPSTLQPLPEPERVKGTFIAQMPAWGEFYARIDITPFVVKGAESVAWVVQEAYIDFSDVVSPNPITLPPGYNSPFAVPGGLAPLWHGFYLKELSARVSNQFTGSDPVSIGLQDVIIDDMGFTGTVFFAPLLDLAEGNLGGWAFSIDSFKVSIVANQLAGAGFNGLVHVSIFSATPDPQNVPTANECFPYRAIFQPGNKYLFSVSMPPTPLQVPMWKAGEVTINPDSKVEIVYADDEFLAVATLSGKVKINGALSPSIQLNIPEIKFEGVRVSNKPKYFEAGRWQFPGSIGAQIGGFELSIRDLAMVQTEQGDPALGFGVAVKLGDGNYHIDADGNFKVIGELRDVGGRQRWAYKNFKVERIRLKGSFQGVASIEGFLDFYEADAVYGNGFRGGVSVSFESLNASVTAVAQFGKKDGFKYFFVDALGCFTLNMGFLDLKGIGGGVYYHMNRPLNGFGNIVCTGSNPVIPPAIGASLSGIIYTPDVSKGIGLKLTVAVAAAGKPDAFNANATFEILFNTGGGLSDIWLYGNGRFMGELDISASPKFDSLYPSNDAQISLGVSLHVNFNERFFDGKLRMFMSVAGGALVGTGQVDVLIGKDKWHFWAGSPSKPISVVFGIPNLIDVGAASMYLQLGNDIEPMPALPEEVRSITGATSTIDISRNWDISAAGGTGFAFGAHIKIGTNERSFLIFYASLSLGLGFDLSVKDLGDGAVCEGRSGPVGINGWYAQGQAYAYLQAAIGLKVKLPFLGTRKFNLAKIAGGVALQAKLPNPFWAKGNFGLEYNILGGLVKGKGRFQFEVGELCELVGDSTENLKIILSTDPNDSADVVSVATNPTIDFSVEIGKTFTIQDDEGNNLSYKAELKGAELFYKGFTLGRKLAWTYNNTRVVLKPDFMLPANDTIELRVKVAIDKGGNEEETEERIVKFVTGKPLDYIPEGNVSGSYPLNGQYNFYKDEIQNVKGYIQLIKGQPNIFYDVPIGYKQAIRFSDRDKNFIETPLTYDGIGYRVEFPIPTTFFQNSQMYKMELVNIPSTESGSAGGAGSRPGSPATGGSSTGGQGGPVEKVIYTAYFRVSQYSTFSSKIAAINQSTSQYSQPGAGLRVIYNMSEPFDEFETEQGGLVVMSASEKDFTGNKPGLGKHDLSPSIQGKFVGTNHYARFYDWFPVNIDCGGGYGWNYHITCNPKPKFTVRVGHSKITESNTKLKIDKKAFDSGVTPSLDSSQYLVNTLFYIISQDLGEVGAKVRGVKSQIISWYKNNVSPDWEEAEGFANDCLEDIHDLDLDLFDSTISVPDGSTGFTIYAAYRLPSKVGNYTLYTITVPPR